MFVDNADLAVIGTKGLSAAFKTLSDQQPVTGETVAVYRELSNYTAGMGGDMEKGSQAMAKFLAQFQKDKTMTEAVKTAGKELGPGFEKILKEANALGLTTYDKFTKGAMSGELGETFKKYAGQLDAVNNTVIGRFKQAFAGIKATFMEMGEPLLGPISEQIPRIANIIDALLFRIRGSVVAIGSGSLLTGLVSAFEKAALFIGNVATNTGEAGKIIDGMKKSWDFIRDVFEKIQDYLRPLVAASEVLGRIAMELFKIFGGGLDNKIKDFSTMLVDNEQKFQDFFKGLGDLIVGFGEFGAVVTNLFIELLPGLGKTLSLLGNLYEMLAKIISPIKFIFKMIMGIAKAIDFVLNPILSVVEKMTFGVVAFKDVIQGLTAAVLAFAAAMLVSSKARGAGKKLFSNMADEAMDGGGGKKGGFKKAGKFLGKGTKGLGKGIMSFGRGLGNVGTKFAGKIGMGGGGGGLGVGGTGAAAALAPLAIAAGSAYAGSKVGGFASDKLFNDDSVLSKTGGAAVGAVSGGATGAMIGAGIGSVFGGVGAVPGAVIGAAVGAIFGGISGWIKAGKEKKEARKAADSILKNYGEGMDKAIENGDIQALLGSRTKAMKELEGLAGSNKYGSKEVKKRRQEIEKLNKQVDTYVGNAGNFQQFGGMDADGMNKMLSEQGIAADAAKNEILNVFKIMRDGGIDVGQAWDTTMGEINQKMLELRLAMFQPAQNELAGLMDAVDAAQQQALAENGSEKSVTKFLETAYEFALGQAGGDAVKATAIMQKTLNTAYGPNGALNKIAGKVQEQTTALNLFDPQTLIDQMNQTGQLQTAGNALESMTGGQMGSSGELQMLIQERVMNAGEGGAAEMDKINTLLRASATGEISADRVAMMLADKTGTLTPDIMIGRLNHMRAKNAEAEAEGREAPFKPVNTQSIDVGGVSIQLSGFINDDKTAKRIAKMISDEVAAQTARKTGGS
jgi:hypothetical protein